VILWCQKSRSIELAHRVGTVALGPWVPLTALLIIGTGYHTTPASAQQPDPEMTELVLPRDFPARLLSKVGRWRLTMVREDKPASLEVVFALGPDSITRMADVLKLSHTCFDCLAGTLSVEWRSLVEWPPTSSRIRVHTNDTSLSAIVGTTVSIVGIGDLELNGRWHGDSAVGTWRQIPHPITARGRFVLRPLPKGEPD
jgi:hypothetical protein